MAALAGKEEVVTLMNLALTPQLKANMVGLFFTMHVIVDVSLVKALIRDSKADITARDDNKDMPIHVAALNGKVEVVLTLIKEFG